MISTAASVSDIVYGKYYTDGTRLYRIIKLHVDWTVTVENCETLFTNRISVDTVLDCWKEVKIDGNVAP